MKTENQGKIYNFVVTGQFDIDSENTPQEDAYGARSGFILPDGRTVRLVVALEIESTDGEEYKYIVSQKAMEEIGFNLFNYDETNFGRFGYKNDDNKS